MIANMLQFGVDRFSGRKAGHLDQPATQILSRNTTRGISMKHIKLTKGQFAIVDDEDFEWLNQWKWHVRKTHCKDGKTYYAQRSIWDKATQKCINIPMHRQILRLKKGDGRQGDHINHRTLDNRRSNLRAVTHEQNCRNRRPQQLTSSRFKGVSRIKGQNKFETHITINDRCINLGHFKSEVEAAKAYNTKAEELFGEHAWLNPV